MKIKIKKIYITTLGLLLVAGFFTMLFATTKPAQKKYGSQAPNLKLSNSSSDITNEIEFEQTPIAKHENESTILSVAKGGNVVITDKKTKFSWSNTDFKDQKAEIAADSDEKLSPIIIGYQKSQLNETIINSKRDSVEKKQYKVFQTKSGVRVEYIFGDNVTTTAYPMAVEKSRFEQKIMAKISDQDKEYMLRRYTLYDYSKITDNNQKKELGTKYPNIKETPFYIATNMDSKIKTDRVLVLLKSVNYNESDLLLDITKSGEAAKQTQEAFKIAVEYSLEGSDIIVKIPKDSIEFYQENPMSFVDLFKFSAIDNDKTGFVLVPQGSGTTIEYGTSEKNSKVSLQYYGEDYANPEKINASATNMTLPVFGISGNSGGYLAIIESGAEIANLNIDLNKKGVSVYPRFNILSYGFASLTGTEKSLVFAQDRYRKDIVVRYKLISKPNCTSSEMAKIYREYLKNNKYFAQKTNISRQNTIVNIICGISENQKIFKIFNSSKLRILTSSTEFEKIKNELGENFDYQLSGVNEKGLLSEISAQKSYVKGYDKEIFSSNTFINKNFIVNYNDKQFDNYNPYKDNLRMSNLSIGTINIYSNALKDENPNRSKIELVKPSKYIKIAKEYIANYPQMNFNVGDLTSRLNSDYNKNQYYSRGSTLDEIVKTLQELKKANIHVRGSNSNVYAFPYLSSIDTISLNSNGNSVFSKDIPFLQMVLHGNIPYYSSDINENDDALDMTLKAIAYGSGLKFTVAMNIDGSLARGDFSYLYYTDYLKNKDEIISLNQQYKMSLENLTNIQIEDYKEIQSKISCTTYENGVKIYVNRTDAPQSVDNIIIPARSFIRKN